MASAIVYPLFSLLPRATENEDEGKFVLWSFLLLLIMVRFAANVVGYTSMAVLVSGISCL